MIRASIDGGARFVERMRARADAQRRACNAPRVAYRKIIHSKMNAFRLRGERDIERVIHDGGDATHTRDGTHR